MARRIVTASSGGKIAVMVAVVLILAFIIITPLLYFFTEGVTDMGPALDAGFVGIMLLLGGIITLSCTWRQRNASISMRKKEVLLLDYPLLTYCFAASSEKHSLRRNAITIDLSNDVEMSYDEERERILFTGTVYYWYYKNVKTDKVLSLNEMHQMDYYEIYNYFEPNLYETLKTCISNKA